MNFSARARKEDAMLGSTSLRESGSVRGRELRGERVLPSGGGLHHVTRHKAFCAVCRRAIERVIGMYTG